MYGARIERIEQIVHFILFPRHFGSETLKLIQADHSPWLVLKY